MSVAEALAQPLRREEGRRTAGRVRLFGSLARVEASPESDVGLGVEGLPPEARFEALAELMRTFGCAVDLVRLEEAPTGLRQRIAEDGEEV